MRPPSPPPLLDKEIHVLWDPSDDKGGGVGVSGLVLGPHRRTEISGFKFLKTGVSPVCRTRPPRNPTFQEPTLTLKRSLRSLLGTFSLLRCIIFESYSVLRCLIVLILRCLTISYRSLQHFTRPYSFLQCPIRLKNIYSCLQYLTTSSNIYSTLQFLVEGFCCSSLSRRLSTFTVPY